MNKANTTQSVCPVCLERIDAFYAVNDDGAVMLEKKCDKHGAFSTVVWDDADDFAAWQNRPLADQTPPVHDGVSDRGCPYDCGLCPDHRQLTCCVLMEVTQRCNMRCPVCFASSDHCAADPDPTLEDTGRYFDMLLRVGGPYNIQLSGGEPTLRDDLPAIIAQGKNKGFSFFQVNTNGLRIARDADYTKALAEAGLNTVFLQFDGLRDETHIALRGRALADEKRRAIDVCADAGLGVVLVPTLRKGVNDDQIGDILRFALSQLPVVRGVHFQPMSFFGRFDGSPPSESRLTIPDVLSRIESQTDGTMPRAAFAPGGAEHPLCGFHADFTVADDGSIRYRDKPAAACCCGSSQARRVVAQKWSGRRAKTTTATATTAPTPSRSRIDTSALDAFLDARANRTLSVSGMAFMDAWNLDLERLKRCYIHEISPDAHLIPFCAYNLTASDGRSLYRNASLWGLRAPKPRA